MATQRAADGPRHAKQNSFAALDGASPQVRAADGPRPECRGPRHHAGACAARSLGRAIACFRGDRTQAALSEAVGLHPTVWSLYEKGRRLPTERNLLRILRALGCTRLDLEDAAWRFRRQWLADEASFDAPPARLHLQPPGSPPAPPVARRGELPTDETPLARLLARGPAALTDAELLDVVLGAGRPGVDDMPAARRILERSHGLAGLSHLGLPVLANLGLPGPQGAALLAVVEIAQRLAFSRIPERSLLVDPPAVAAFLALKYHRGDQEVMGAMFADVKGGLLETCELFRGTLSSSRVEPRQVVKRALLVDAASFVLFHTHPSDDPTPSEADLRFTRHMAKVARAMGMEMRDHMILGRSRWISLRQRRVF